MLLWLILVSLALAVAGDDQIRVTLVVDDREALRLVATQVVVEQTPPVSAPLLDDGSCVGDMPGDHILTACFDIQKRESLSFGVLEGSQRLGAFNLFLPNAGEATVSLRTRSGAPALLLDMAAERPAYSAPEGPGADTTPKDKILVMVTIDGREGAGLVSPQLRALDRDDELVTASDAGLLLGDKAGDRLWRADLAVLRTDTLLLGLFDEGREIGRASLVLPAKQRAYVVLTPSDAPPGLVATQSQEAPADDVELDSILLMVALDDRAAGQLNEPWIRVTDRDGVQPVYASDAGLLLGDEAGDGIWRADLTVERTDTLGLALLDGDTELGELELELPTKRRAAVVLTVDAATGQIGATFDQELPSAENLESCLLKLAITDTTGRALTAPEIRVEGQQAVEPALASDEGLLSDDVAGDGTWRAELSVLRTPTLTIVLFDGETSLGKGILSLPSSSEVEVTVLRSGDPPELSLAASAASALQTIHLMLRVDDRAADLLTLPTLRLPGMSDPVALVDDGSAPGDVAQDSIFLAEVEIERQPSVSIELLDEGESRGSVDVPLPASGSAEVDLRTRQGSPGVILVEARESGSGGGTAGGGGSFWLLVWLNIGLFIVLFAWVRRSVRRAIDKELSSRGQAGTRPPEPGS